MIDFLASKEVSRFSGWIRLSLVCASVVGLLTIETGLAMYLKNINASLAGQITELSADNIPATASLAKICSEELDVLRRGVERYSSEKKSLLFPRALIQALAEGLPAHAWLERISIKGADVTISGKVAHGADAFEVTDAIRASGALSSVVLDSLKPLPSGGGTGFEFIVLGQAHLPHNL